MEIVYSETDLYLSLASVIMVSAETQPLPVNYGIQNADEIMPDLSMVNPTLWATYRDKVGLNNGEPYMLAKTHCKTLSPPRRRRESHQ